MFSISGARTLFFKKNGKEETPQGGKEAQEREATREAPPLTQNSPDSVGGVLMWGPRLALGASSVSCFVISAKAGIQNHGNSPRFPLSRE